MKKIKILAVIFVTSLALTACSSSPEKLVCQFEKACEQGNTEKAERILEKMEKLGEDKFTKNQEERILEAYDNYMIDKVTVINTYKMV